jgi:hypothetical protein
VSLRIVEVIAWDQELSDKKRKAHYSVILISIRRPPTNSNLLQLNLAFDLMRETDPAERH